MSPSFIENQLRAIPYVAEAMVVGHARKYLTALIEIDFDTVADWARGSATSPTPASPASPSILACERLIEAELARVNGALARVEQIKAFRILPKALDPEEEGEPVTPTRKVKRARMLERFRAWSSRCTTTAKNDARRRGGRRPENLTTETAMEKGRDERTLVFAMLALACHAPRPPSHRTPTLSACRAR